MKTYSVLLSDFDGTLTKTDLLHHLTKSLGKGFISQELISKFQREELDGLQCLSERIELLKGYKVHLIQNLLSPDLLLPGFSELRNLADKKEIKFILMSGNISPIINYYGRLLGIDKAFCTELLIENDYIVGISPNGIGKKVDKVKKYLSKIGVSPHQVIVIGNDRSDIPFFEFAGWSIAFNGHQNIKCHAKQIFDGNLYQLVTILDRIMKP